MSRLINNENNKLVVALVIRHMSAGLPYWIMFDKGSLNSCAASI